MNKLAQILIAIVLLFSFSCQDSARDKELDKKLEELKIKLEATEAQLLNVSAELSKCKGNYTDSLETK